MHLRRWITRATAVVALSAPMILVARPADAIVVERIVAVVGEQPILLTELRQRARPNLLRLYTIAKEQKLSDAEIKVQESGLFKELLSKLVKERLVSLAADKLNVTVTVKEVDDAIKLKAADLKLQVNEMVEEANKMGLSELDYREEVRRELLFSKMLETRVRSRVRVTEDDINEYYRKILVSERETQKFRASVITLELPTGPEGEARRAFADALVKSARSGYDFATLARKYSIDLSRDKGGDLGTRMPGGFGKPIDLAILRIDVGQVSEPLVYGNKLMIVKVTERPPSQVPALPEVHDIIASRVRDEMFNKEVERWLDELKQGVYIDIRL